MNLISNHKLLLSLLILFAFASRVWRLWEPNVFYFDEVYHAYTAEAYARNDPAGYEWWHNSPEQIPYCQDPHCAAYEWLHPPLAKLIQAGSIKILGDKPFAWRYPGVLFSLGTIILLYLLGLRVFGSSVLGLMAAFIYSLDGLAFTSSRITMNDTYLAFWVVLAVYLFLRNKSLWLIGLVLGLAVSTKWPGIFAIGFMSFLWFVNNFKTLNLSKLLKASIAFVILPAVIYMASYVQFWLQGDTIAQFGELHQQIWWYQTNLKATHPYQSKPLDWMFMVRPLYAYAKGFPNEWVENIYLMGNPFVFWGGLVAFMYAVVGLFQAKTLKDKKAFPLLAVLFAYLGIFTPWFFSPRIMFIYHYVPAVPFLSFLLAWFLNKNTAKYKVFVTCYMLLIAVAFVYFYPHWTGIPVPGWLDKSYYWFRSWR